MKDKHWLGIIGVLISCLGWTAVSADHFPLVFKIITPEFYDARMAFDTLKQKNAVLTKGDRGFPQISGTLKTLMGRDPALEMTQIRTMESGFEGSAQPTGSRWVSHLTLEVTFHGFAKEMWQLGGLEEAIKKRYLSFNLFLWGSIVFGTGLTLGLIAVFMKE
jgi:hypothetical protein